ncbi:MAG: hypothetical protein FWF90_15580 [Promicromonosporaceae bacterium]|nr:hypothetical protein [Promicromonosporaceae bacterium]
MKLSSCIEMMFAELPFAKRIQAAKDAGFDGYEFWGWYGKDLVEIADAQAECGLPLAACGIGSRDESRRSALKGGIVRRGNASAFAETVAESIEATGPLGVKTLLVTTGNELSGVCREAQAEAVAEALATTPGEAPAPAEAPAASTGRSRSRRKPAATATPAPAPEEAVAPLEPVVEEEVVAVEPAVDAAEAVEAPSMEVQVAQTLADLAASTSGPVTASALKRTLLRKDPTFSEADYGFRTFTEFLRFLADREFVELTDGTTGDPEVSLPKQGTSDENFALVRDVVQEVGAPVPLSGLKNRLRKRRPDFSEKALGFRGFLQFCRAAEAAGAVVLTWDDATDDYLVTAA